MTVGNKTLGEMTKEDIENMTPEERLKLAKKLAFVFDKFRPMFDPTVSEDYKSPYKNWEDVGNEKASS